MLPYCSHSAVSISKYSNREEVFAIKRLRIQEAISIEVDKQSSLSMQEGKSGSTKAGSTVYCTVAAIHAGVTKNSTVYPADKLQGGENTGVASWTAPYHKPVLVHHDKHRDAVGRVQKAEYVKGPKPFIKLTLHITDLDAAQKVLDGRYSTVSIGAETNSATCSICGQDIVQSGFCGHWRGNTYDGEVCRWILGDLWFQEVSFVNVPADQHAMVLSKHLAEESAEAQLLEKLGDGTAVLVVVSDEDNAASESRSADAVISVKEGAETVDELEKLKAQVAELEEKAAGLEDAKTALEQEKEGLAAELEEAKAKVSELEEAVNTLTEEKSGLTAEKEQLLTELEKKTEQLHESLAERIVDMRIMLSKPVEEKREDEVAKYAQRSYESLRDTMTDLMAEYQAALPGLRAQIEKVTNPGAAVDDGMEPNSMIEGVESKPDLSAESIRKKTEAVLSGLFGGTKRVQL